VLYGGDLDTVFLQRGAAIDRGHEVTVSRYDGLVSQIDALELHSMIGCCGLEGERHYLSCMETYTTDGKGLFNGLLK
jgi:hypothetical protein